MSSRDAVPPQVSVVVMTFNRPASLRRCLESLAQQTMARDTFEVVLVDVSDPPVAAIVDEFSATLHIEHCVGRNLGVAGNRNRGVEHAQAAIVAFLDDDCVAQPDWLELLHATVAKHPNSIVGGRVANREPGNACMAAGQAITEAVDAFYNPPGAAPRFFPGLNFALEREAYRAIGGCDVGFGRLAAEDRDFIDRWRSAGGRLVACPLAVVQHEHRATLKGFSLQYFNYGRGAWHYNLRRRLRRGGVIVEDTQLHRNLPRYFHEPMRRLSHSMRVRVALLLGVWQVSNALGFLYQAMLETSSKKPGRHRPGR